MNRTVLSVLAAIPLLTPASTTAKCARAEVVPALLTTRDTKLPADGGFLIGWTRTVDANAVTSAGDPSDQPLAAKTGTQPVSLKRVALAPGLSAYFPATFRGALAVELPGANSRPAQPFGSFTRDGDAKPVAMPAPAAVTVALSQDKTARWQSRHAVVTLSAAPPDAARALITYVTTAGKPVAVTFVTLADTHDTVKTIEAFEDAGHCGFVVAGSHPPAAGDRVTFAWVDAFGRVSPTSAPITAN
jgi:hypothetical protein